MLATTLLWTVLVAAESAATATPSRLHGLSFDLHLEVPVASGGTNRSGYWQEVSFGGVAAAVTKSCFTVEGGMRWTKGGYPFGRDSFLRAGVVPVLVRWGPATGERTWEWRGGLLAERRWETLGGETRDTYATAWAFLLGTQLVHQWTHWVAGVRGLAGKSTSASGPKDSWPTRDLRVDLVWSYRP